MNEYIAEFIGTMILILLGDGVCANVSLNESKGKGGGWIVVALGWGLAVYMGVVIAGPYSGAHINPAVTIGLALVNLFPWAKVLPYIIAQMLGGALGASLVWLFYIDHFNKTKNPASILGCYATIPSIRRFSINLFSETIGTFVLILVIYYISGPSIEGIGLETVKIGLGSVGALPVSLLIVSIGLSLGGTTGYAINPARDLAPRFIHWILPMKYKGTSDWSYSWVPIVGPILGTILASVVFILIGK